MLKPALRIISIGILSASVSAQSVWKKLPVGELHYHASAGDRPFMDYREHVKLPANRMAGDGAGRLFLSDDSVYWTSQDDGESWHSRTLSPVPKDGISPNPPPAPFFVGAEGAVQWGICWYSWDHGENWEYRPYTKAGNLLREAPAILQVKSATVLASYHDSQDGIRNTNDTGLTWKSSHGEDYYFSILQFEAPDSQWVFASGEQLLVSRDGGSAWTKWGVATSGMFPYKISLQKASQAWTLWGIYDSTAREGLRTFHYPKLLRYPSSGAPDSRSFALPDSSVTAFRAQDDGTLWLGTWGKGVFSSADQGATWVARNEGLGILRIETLYRGPEGGLFAITPDGVYRLGGQAQTSLRSATRRQRSASRSVSPQNLFHLPGSPFETCADGRRSHLH